MNNRDYHNLDLYYEELLSDVYPQPMDDGHLNNMMRVITKWLAPIGGGSVIDVGCGFGEAGTVFRGLGFSYGGITLAEGVVGGPIFIGDYNFLPDVSADIVFSRHSLEHSPFPLLTLMEWHRVSSKWLCLVLPNPEHYKFVGRNHYSVMEEHQSAWLLRRAGWKIRKFRLDTEEIWFLCEKFPRISYEGWADVPLSRSIHEFERDMLKQGELDVQEYARKRKIRELF